MVTWNCDRDSEIKGQGCGNKTKLVVVVVARVTAFLRKWHLSLKGKEETSQVRTGVRALEHMQRLWGWKWLGTFEKLEENQGTWSPKSRGGGGESDGMWAWKGSRSHHLGSLGWAREFGLYSKYSWETKASLRERWLHFREFILWDNLRGIELK